MHVHRDAEGSHLHSEINITPLVDVVLVLLIIFMVVVPLMLKGYAVSIPQSSPEIVPAQAEEPQVILSIVPASCHILGQPAGEGLPQDCRVTVGEREIPVADLAARVSEVLGNRPAERRVLFIAADDRLNYEGVLRIVDVAKSRVDDLKIEFITTD
jgi:biopolymer transport protein ExbD